MLSINTNHAASVSASNLVSTNAQLQRSLQRLSSGSRIVESSDDAGGLAVSLKMTAALRRTEATSINLANAQSFLKTQDGALSSISKVLIRMSELAVLAQDVTKTSSDRANYTTEFNSLKEQIENTMKEKFNGVTMFAPATASTASVLTVYTDESSSTTTAVTLHAISTGNLGTVMASGTSGISIAEITSAQSAVGVLNNAIQELSTMRAQNGSEASKISFAQDLLVTNRNNLELANSRIVDVDVASESTRLARFNTLQQAGTAMLAQANQSAQSVLRLLQG